jgi:hypothetical protein
MPEERESIERIIINCTMVMSKKVACTERLTRYLSKPIPSRTSCIAIQDVKNIQQVNR